MAFFNEINTQQMRKYAQFALLFFVWEAGNAQSSLPFDTVLAAEYTLRGQDAHLRGMHDSSMYYFRKAQKEWLEADKALDLPQTEHRLLINMAQIGYCYLNLNYFDSALIITHELERITRGDNFHWETKSLLSQIYNKLGNHERALAWALEAKNGAIASEFGKKYGYKNYRALGTAYLDAGYPSVALDYFLKDREWLIKKSTDPDWIAYQNERKVKAQSLNLRVKDYMYSMEYHLAQNLRYQAQAYRRLNDYKQVHVCTSKALNYFQKTLQPNHYIIADLLEMLGDLEADNKNYLEAIAYYQRVSSIIHINHAPLVKHSAYCDISYKTGLCFEKIGNLDSALRYYHQGLAQVLPIYEKSAPLNLPSPQDAPLLVLPYLRVIAGQGRVLGKINKTQQRYLQAADTCFQLAQFFFEQTRTSYLDEEDKLTFQQVVIAAFQDGIGVAFQLYNLTDQNDYLERAYGYSELSKAATLSDALKSTEARKFSGLPPETIAQERNFRQELAYIEECIAREEGKGEKTDSTHLVQLQSRHFNSQIRYDSLISKLEEEFPHYFDLKYRTYKPSIEALQQKISSTSTFLEFFFSRDHLHLFEITADKVQLHQLPWESGWDEALRNFISELKKPGFDSIYDQSLLWGDRLLKPINLTSVKNLIIVPDGLLGYVPFELLATRNNKDYLGNEFTIRYAYSGELLDKTSSRDKTDMLYAGFAPTYGNTETYASVRGIDSTTRDQLSPLRYNQQEVKGIGALLEGEVFLAEAATEKAFMKMPRSRILHLAMHAFINDKNPLFSGLAFSLESPHISLRTASKKEPEEFDLDRDLLGLGQDGFLHAYEIYNMELNADLVVLSACQTGAGKLQKGEGVMSLARAFRYAGCPNIVMSLWPVDDQATSLIMERFFLHLKNGWGKADALQRAKIDYQKLGPGDKQSPFYWAGFVLIGDNEPVMHTSGIFHVLLAFLTLILIAIKPGLVLPQNVAARDIFEKNLNIISLF